MYVYSQVIRICRITIPFSAFLCRNAINKSKDNYYTTTYYSCRHVNWRVEDLIKCKSIFLKYFIFILLYYSSVLYNKRWNQMINSSSHFQFNLLYSILNTCTSLFRLYTVAIFLTESVKYIFNASHVHSRFVYSIIRS